MKPLSESLLYGILDSGYVSPEPGPMASMARSLIAGGIDLLQLRAKRETEDQILAIAHSVAPLCREAGIPFLLNDHPSLVTEAGADGAHVGQDDLTVAEARELVGPGKLIGKSTHSLPQALAAVADAPDYIGFGPLFATQTKPDYTPIGTDEITEVQTLVPMPVFCIGGIKESNLPMVLASGARRVVIVSDLLTAPDPTARTAACKGMLCR